MLDIQEQENNKNELPSNKSSIGIKILVIVSIIFILFVIFMFLNKSNEHGNGITLRDANEKDIILNQSIEATIASLQDAYEITPLHDINDLEITFIFYDSSKKVLSRIIKNLGDVWKNRTYYITIEHSLSDIFKIKKYSYKVTNGTIPLF